MPNLSTILKSEITRLAKRAVRQEIDPVRSSSSTQRKQLAELKRQVQELRRELAAVKKSATKQRPAASEPQDEAKHRFTAKGLKSLRSRLELSAEDFGLLIGVSGKTIYMWEQENSEPRKAYIPKIAELRTIGKRQVRAKLDELKGSEAASA